jgi:endonuclease YncB( thermonuclease family)
VIRFHFISLLLGLFLAASACHSAADKSHAAAPTSSEDRWLLIGEFRLSDTPVIDGDTIRVEGLDHSVRLVSLDTEETFHSKADRKDAAQDFDAYLRAKRGDQPHPTKAATPMGEEAKDWAERFFEGVDSVELERDAARTTQDRYGRTLAHAFARKKGKRLHYNLEAIRSGMSPYFVKYGYSERFHDAFSRAEAEARAAQRGIWDAGKKAYRDYPERKAWWTARADAMQGFEREARTRSDYIVLTRPDADAELERNLGREVTVLGSVQRIDPKKTLVRVWLGKRRGSDFPLIFFDRDVYHRSALDRHRGELVTVRGTVERYAAGEYQTLQIVVKNAKQVELSGLPR